MKLDPRAVDPVGDVSMARCGERELEPLLLGYRVVALPGGIIPFVCHALAGRDVTDC